MTFEIIHNYGDKKHEKYLNHLSTRCAAIKIIYIINLIQMWEIRKFSFSEFNTKAYVKVMSLIHNINGRR